MANPTVALATLHELHTLGIRFAIDDFGTGYSSMAYLKQLSVDELKIDRTFVGTMDSDGEDAVLVRSAIDLGHNLGLSVTAEGAETAEQIAALTALGCDVIQGYFFGKPMPAADLAAWRHTHDAGSPPRMQKTLPRGRLPVMNGDWLTGGGDVGPDRVLGGRYQLICQVGAGGMAVVWQAYDSVLARTVAVKVLASHYADGQQSRDQIRQEARAAAVLSHPNIAQVYDYGEADIDGETIPYVVMELIRGDTLHQRLCDGPIPPRYAMRVCAEIAAALAAAHAEGLAHRDIKPANIMLAPTGAKVVDFGIAAAIQAHGSGADDFEVLGTPAYLAPERLLHDAVEPASDVYALGVLLYRLLTGHSPWTSETTTQMLTAHIYVEPAPLLPMPQVPPYVTVLGNRCLAKDPAARPSARVAATLLARGAGLQVITDEPPAQEQAAIEVDPSVLIRPAGSDDRRVRDQADGLAVEVPGLAPADREVAGPPPRDAALGTPSAPLAQPSVPAAGIRHRMAYVLVPMVLFAAVAAAVWILVAPHRPATVSAPPPAASAAATGNPAGTPTTGSGASSGAPVAGPQVGGPTVAVGTGTIDPTSGQAAPANPFGTTPTAAISTVAGPGPTVTSAAPATEPGERTLSSTAGSVRATCPSTGTAQILSWTAAKPYRAVAGDQTAGPAPAVTFKHGNAQVTMTVTCDGGVPSATTA